MPFTDYEEIERRLQTCGCGLTVQLGGAGRIAPDRWRYAGQEAFPQKQGRYRSYPGVSGWRGSLTNTVEANNNGEEVEGSGDDVGAAPDGITLWPLGPGAVVLNVVRRVNAQGLTEVAFSQPNNLGGRCSS